MSLNSNAVAASPNFSQAETVPATQETLRQAKQEQSGLRQAAEFGLKTAFSVGGSVAGAAAGAYFTGGNATGARAGAAAGAGLTSGIISYVDQIRYTGHIDKTQLGIDIGVAAGSGLVFGGAMTDPSGNLAKYVLHGAARGGTEGAVSGWVQAGATSWNQQSKTGDVNFATVLDDAGKGFVYGGLTGATLGGAFGAGSYHFNNRAANGGSAAADGETPTNAAQPDSIDLQAEINRLRTSISETRVTMKALRDVREAQGNDARIPELTALTAQVDDNLANLMYHFEPLETRVNSRAPINTSSDADPAASPTLSESVGSDTIPSQQVVSLGDISRHLQPDAIAALQLQSGDIIFMTEKGSVYKTIGPNKGGSQRYKSQAIEQRNMQNNGDPAGRLDKSSTGTFYISEEYDAILDRYINLNWWEDKKPEFYANKHTPNQMGIFVHDSDGRLIMEPERIISFSNKPQVGLSPLETFYVDGARTVHLGDRITKVITISEQA